MSEAITVCERSLTEIELSVRVKTANLRRYLVAGICDIAQDLIEAKSKCPRGQWLDSLKRMGYSSSTASNYIQIYNEMGGNQNSLNFQTFGNLPYSKALALLALPEGDRDEFVEAVDLESVSVRELKAKVEEYKAAKTEAENQASGWKMKAAQANAEAKLSNEAADELRKELELAAHLLSGERENASALKREIDELKARPVEVAVRTIDATAEQLEVAEKKGHNAALKESADKMETAAAEWKKQVAALSAQLKLARQENVELCTERNELKTQVNELTADRDSSRQPPDAPGKAEEINATFRSVVESTNKLLALLGELDEVAQAKVRAKLSGFFHSAAEKVKK